MNRSDPVEEWEYASAGQWPDSLRDCQRPVVLRDFVSHWPAVRRARTGDVELAAYLNQFDAQQPITVYRLHPEVEGGRIGYLDDFSGFSFSRDTALLEEILLQLTHQEEAGPSAYIGSSRTDKWLPGFSDENDIAFNQQKAPANFWLGGRTQVAVHCDTPRNLACCVSGERTFTLFPPEQIANLYIGPVDLTPSGRPISLVNHEHPDLERYPRFAEALKHSKTVTLKPGDALYIPSLWWHGVTSTGALNMLVNYWWKDTPDHMGIPDLALDHALLTLRGLPPEQKQAWRSFFDYYIFGDSDIALEHVPEAVRGILSPHDEQAAQRAWFSFSRKLHR